MCLCVHVRACVHVCVCVFERERGGLSKQDLVSCPHPFSCPRFQLDLKLIVHSTPLRVFFRLAMSLITISELVFFFIACRGGVFFGVCYFADRRFLFSPDYS